MNKNYNLSKIIFNDIMLFHKKQLILLFMILLSSILIITIIHKTRLLISKKEQLNNIQKEINREWIMLNLEKSIMLSHSTLKENTIKIDT